MMSQLKKANTGTKPRSNVSDIFEKPDPEPERKEKMGKL